MSDLEEAIHLKEQGMSDEEISRALLNKGLDKKQVLDVLSQTKIKEAVTGEAEDIKALGAKEDKMAPENPAFEGMQPSMLHSEAEEAPQEYYPPAPIESPQQEYYSQPYQDTQYQPYQGAVSSDTITEISEQIVDERLSLVRTQIEKVLDFKNTVESKMEYLDERLKRIEKIIDRLQISILQKVGEYVSNVDDIKKELVETQKSFKSLSQFRHSPPQQHPHQPEHLHKK